MSRAHKAVFDRAQEVETEDTYEARELVYISLYDEFLRHGKPELANAAMDFVREIWDLEDMH